MNTIMGKAKTLGAVILILAMNTPALAKTLVVEVPTMPRTSDNLQDLFKDSSSSVKRPQPSFQYDGPRAALGGVSDGGGNAVGTTLFDFYENEGSKELTITKLVELEPLAVRILQALDAAVPANYLVRFEKQGFGTAILKAVASKKIYLESKSIQSAGCINQSMVAASEQMIVACQSDLEIRFNKVWFDKADATNRAGLIMHELILGWARANSPDADKSKTEALVRDLNRQIFTLPETQWASAINASFPQYHALSVSDLREQGAKAAQRMQQARKGLQVLDRSRAVYRGTGLEESFESLRQAIASAEMPSDACQTVVSSFNSFARVSGKPALNAIEICGK